MIRKNSIYLCGSSDDKQTGASFIKVDLSGKITKINYLITSCYNHIYPSMILSYNDIIFVIGGKNSKKCELYNVKSNKKCFV